MIVHEILTPLSEVNPDTLAGSFGRNLLLAKTWLIDELEQIQTDFDTIYILGSWYGNMSLLLAASKIKYKQIYNVDTDQQSLTQGQQIADQLGLDRIDIMCKDANTLDYRQLGAKGLVINTSCNNMDRLEWLENIPPGTMVALQGRNNDPEAVTHYNDFQSFDQDLPITKTIYQDEIRLKDPETEHECYMKIGIR